MKRLRPLLLLPLTAGCVSLRPLSSPPRPAVRRLEPDENRGGWVPLSLAPARIYGLGLTYASHIEETGSRRAPGERPPVFRKAPATLNPSGTSVRIPSRRELLSALEEVEPGLGEEVGGRFRTLPPLLDYEAELAMVFLEDVDGSRLADPDYVPRLGYFLANDVSARSVAVLGEGRSDRMAFWGASKSFPGFLPVGPRIWIPDEIAPDAVPRLELKTVVNGETRQRESTADLLYTPGEMIRFVAWKYPEELPRRGDILLTGTPGGTALRVSVWKARLADLLGIGRVARLHAMLRSGRRSGKFLKAGDEVTVSGGPLGSVRTRIVR